MHSVRNPIVGVVAIVLAVSGALAHDTASSIDPKVVEVLAGMDAYMDELDGVELKALNSADVRLDAGLMAAQATEAHIRARKPASFRATIVGDAQNVDLYIAGGLLTVFSPESRYYAQAEAPESIGDALDFALEELVIDAPMSDFFQNNIAEGMLEAVDGRGSPQKSTSHGNVEPESGTGI